MDEKFIEVLESSELRNELLLECIKVIKSTPTNHAHTTYELGLIQETINKTVKHFENYFGI